MHAKQHLTQAYSSRWRDSPHTFKTSALTLCYCAAEYACPVRSWLVDAQRLDHALNNNCRIIAGCLKSTNTNCLYLLAELTPPDIGRDLSKASNFISRQLNYATKRERNIKLKYHNLHTNHSRGVSNRFVGRIARCDNTATCEQKDASWMLILPE